MNNFLDHKESILSDIETFINWVKNDIDHIATPFQNSSD